MSNFDMLKAAGWSDELIQKAKTIAEVVDRSCPAGSTVYDIQQPVLLVSGTIVLDTPEIVTSSGYNLTF